MRADEIQEGDQFVSDDGRLYWTALGDAEEPSGGEVYVLVREASGRVAPRWLPVGVELPIRRPGVSP